MEDDGVAAAEAASHLQADHAAQMDMGRVVRGATAGARVDGGSTWIAVRRRERRCKGEKFEKVLLNVPKKNTVAFRASLRRPTRLALIYTRLRKRGDADWGLCTDLDDCASSGSQMHRCIDWSCARNAVDRYRA